MPIINDSFGSVGGFLSAHLTEAQVQTLHGPGWVLADGRDVTGSRFASLTGSNVVPDLRGMVLRGKNNTRSDGHQNPDGEAVLGTFQADQFGSHHHSYIIRSDVVVSSSGVNMMSDSANQGTGNTNILNSGGNETRMKNVTVNHFVRIN